MQVMPYIWNRKAAAAAIVALTLLGCGTKANDAAKNAPAKAYQLHGEVKSIDASGHTATIKHDSIPGFMNAMTMGYQVKDPDALSKLKVGESIDATLNVSDEDMWLSNIKEAQK